MAPVSKSAAGRVPFLLFGLQVLLALGAIGLGGWEGLPWLGLVGAGVAIALAAVVSHTGTSSRLDLSAWWTASLLYPAALRLAHTGHEVPAITKAVILVLLGTSGLLASVRTAAPASRARWRVSGLAWASVGLSLVVMIAYRENLKTPFYIGSLLGIALLALYLAWYRPPTLVIQALNTLILLSAALLLVGLFQHDPETAPLQAGTDPLFRYADARKDPAGFKRWWVQYRHHWASMLPKLFEMHPGDPLFYRPRPGSDALFYHCRVSLNGLGFRGKELAQPKGDTYRIVALGESTTFGSTLYPEDRPWPELLEDMIRERLRPARPVEVVNAGIPSYGLTNNLLRLPTHILPLKPDLLLSYHGYNGFPMLYGVAPPADCLYPPVYAPRPIKLLADCEYHLRLLRYRRLRAAQRLAPDAAGKCLQTEFARAYRALIQVARTNSFHLALSTYSMAVNPQSEPQVMAFYQHGFPDAPVSVQANAVHSQLVRQLCNENPDVIYVDSRPALDGQHDLYLDLMHFTPEADRLLAEAMFQAIKPVLERDLAPQPSSSP